MNFDDLARSYAMNHPELGNLDDCEITEEGEGLYFFENGSILITDSGEIITA